jgi:hypothetical protein
VIAQDQRGAALADAICVASVRWPDGHNESISGQTNFSGVAIMSLNVVNQPFGNLVFIDVSCGYNGLTGSITTSFRVWH